MRLRVTLVYEVEADGPKVAIENVMNNKDREPVEIHCYKPED
jgi:hypothetical protein